MDIGQKIETVFRLTPAQKTGLKKLRIETLEDLLLYPPLRYTSFTQATSIAHIVPDEDVTLFGTITDVEVKKTYKSKTPITSAKLVDIAGDTIDLIWFHQPYIGKTYTEGTPVHLHGVVSVYNGKRSITNPSIERIPALPIDAHKESLFHDSETGDELFAYPRYGETKGVTSIWLQHSITRLLRNKLHEQIPEILPGELLQAYNLPNRQTAIVWMHAPKNQKHAEAAKKRFAFENMFSVQLGRAIEREKYRQEESFIIISKMSDLKEHAADLGFHLTKGQEKAVTEITKDMASGAPMMRLLEGDVGSGKTLIAALASKAVIETRPKGQNFGTLQVAIMAPTEVLATQLFENFIKFFKNYGMQVGLITGKSCRKFPSKVYGKTWTDISRTQLKKWIANGEIPIVVGTHALIAKTLEFKHLALAIVDEQHRFGTAQRMALAKRSKLVPHFLSMTATPIPRTLALTMYGDLDLTILDELPPGRKAVQTTVVTPDKRSEVYEHIRSLINEGRQAYVICPRIDAPDPDSAKALIAKSVTAEAAHLKKNIFPEFSIDVMHSKMLPKKKESVLNDFYSGKTQILVSTSVVEVGVNVPNATAIIIEGAERFGLSQLHQLRGRVMRSSHQPYCYLFTEANSDKSKDRLRAFVTAKNGFELAELDLSLRGAGDLVGAEQSGLSDTGMEALKNLKLVQAARDAAKIIAGDDIELRKYPELKRHIEKQKHKVHFE